MEAKVKWEYLTVNILKTDSRLEIVRRLGLVGDDGWELVSVDNGVAYFKRISKKWEQEIIRKQMGTTPNRYSYDTVQDGYVIYDNSTLMRIEGHEVVKLLNEVHPS